MTTQGIFFFTHNPQPFKPSFLDTASSLLACPSISRRTFHSEKSHTSSSSYIITSGSRDDQPYARPCSSGHYEARPSYHHECPDQAAQYSGIRRSKGHERDVLRTGLFAALYMGRGEGFELRLPRYVGGRYGAGLRRRLAWACACASVCPLYLLRQRSVDIYPCLAACIQGRPAGG